MLLFWPIKWIVPGLTRKWSPNCWSQRSKLWGPKASPGVRVEWSGERRRYDAFHKQWFSCFAQSRWPPGTTWWRHRVIVFVGRAPQSKGHCGACTHAASDPIHFMNAQWWDATMVGVATERWSKVIMHTEVVQPYHRITPLSSGCALSCKWSDDSTILSRTSWRALPDTRFPLYSFRPGHGAQNAM